MKKLLPYFSAATLRFMKNLLYAGAALALLAAGTAGARAETRMQVSAASASIRTQPAADAPAIGRATAGEILFVSYVEGDWAAISPPDRIDLWLNKDFIEDSRVIARSIQLRAGPGVQHPVVGVLERGAPVLARGEEGDWCKIAAPSSATLWIKKNDLADVQAPSKPIQAVAPVPEPAPPAPEPAIAPPPPAPRPEPRPEPVAPPSEVAIVAPVPAPMPVPAAAPAPPPAPKPVPRIAASRPQTNPPPARTQTAPSAAPSAPPFAPAPAAQPIARPTPPPPAVAAHPTVAARPPAAPTLRPATGLPVQSRPPRATSRPAAATTRPAPAARPAARPAAQVAAPGAPPVAKPRPRRIEVEVDPDLVDDLDLEDLPNQGRPVRVEGELRNAPFMAGSPSRYRLQARDETGVLEMICHVHGDSAQLRRFVGKTIAIRGREYWVEDSDMPVVVVGQVEPQTPSGNEYEPVMF